MAQFTVKKDGTGDYTTIEDAVAAVRALSDVTGNVIEVHEGVYVESFTIDGRNGAGRYHLTIVAVGNVIWSGDNTLAQAFKATRWDFAPYYLIVKGFTFRNFTSYAVFIGNTLTGFSNPGGVELNNCRVYGNVAHERCQLTKYRDTVFYNTSFFYTSNGNASVITIGFVQNCTFVNCNDIRILNPTALGLDPEGKLCSSNVFYNTNVGIIQSNQIRDNNIFVNCQGKVYGGSATNSDINGLPWTPFTNLTELNSIPSTTVTWSNTQAYFRALVLDTYGFQTNNEAEINFRHIGATRLASTAEATVPAHVTYDPAKFDLTGGEVTRLVTTTESFTFNLPDFDTAQVTGRLFLHFNELTPTLDEEYTVELERSLDGVTFLPPEPVMLGLQDQGGSVYEYVLNNGMAKAAKAIVTVSGSVAGSKKFLGFTLESRVLEDYLPQGSRTVLVQLDAITNGNLLEGGNVTFVMPEIVRQYMPDTNKATYTFEEIEALAVTHPTIVTAITYADGPATNLTSVAIQSPSKLITIFTFNQF